MIIKVKEPIESEYGLVREGQLVFTYFHFACDQQLTEAMIKSKSVCMAYETVVDRQGALPLLIPMSEVAGRMSVQEGARFLKSHKAGKEFYWVECRGKTCKSISFGRWSCGNQRRFNGCRTGSRRHYL